MTCFNIYYVHRKCRLLGTGSVPKITPGKGCAPKKLGQVSWDPDLQLGKLWQKTGSKQQNFQESHHLCQLLFGWDLFRKLLQRSFEVLVLINCLLPFFFFFKSPTLIDCSLGRQQLAEAERPWLHLVSSRREEISSLS